MEYNFPMLTLAVVVCFAAVAFIVWRVAKANPGLTLGEILLRMTFQEKISIFILIPIIINISQAGLAASIHPAGQDAYPAIVRFTIHISISIVAIVAGLYASPMHMLYKSEKEAFHKNNKDAKKLPERIKALHNLSIAMLAAAIVFPLMNVLIIAGGLNHTQQLKYFFMFWHPWGGSVAWSNMHYIFQALLVESFAHYVMMWVDSYWIKISENELLVQALKKSLVSTGGGSTTYSGTTAPEKNKSKKEETDLSNVNDGIKYILSRYGYKDEQLAEKIKTAQSIIDKMAISDRAGAIRLAAEISKIVQDTKSFDYSGKGNLSAEKIAAKNEEFRYRIFSLFRDTTVGGKGFGMTLKGGKQFKSRTGN